ncbi:hypothetical protein WEI85_08825 [Actinomycetes bacterium KLBMP 9797]
MKYIKIEQTELGFSLDPTAYLDRLEAIAAQLPPGAAAFAREPGHYAFGDRCPKDLKLDRASLVGTALELSFVGYTPEPRLVIRYDGVVSFTAAADEGEDDLGRVQLDEILPHDRGCRHEIKLIAGTVAVVCADLTAKWTLP